MAQYPSHTRLRQSIVIHKTSPLLSAIPPRHTNFKINIMECSAVTRADESQNKCDRQLTLSYEPVSNNSHNYHTVPILQTIQLTLPKNDLINPNWSIIGKFNQEIEILPLKCGKWKLGGKKLWKVEIRG